jgi:AmmeMemoRadiSam system protein B/uncharacterized protein (TIGR00296 family)
MPTLGVSHSPFAGTWYPDDTHALRRLLERVGEESRRRTGDFVRQGGIAFVAPHASPGFSGTVAAAVYRHVRLTGAARVIVLGFCHRLPIRGIAVPDIDFIETPLGRVRLDRDSVARLAACRTFRRRPADIARDHSVEIQLPFLQEALPEAAVVPLYVGRMDARERHEAAEALSRVVDSKTVLIASSDLTHYGRDFGYVPFATDERTAERLRTLDGNVMDAAGSIDDGLFLAAVEELGATACGVAPVALLLATLRALGREDLFQETLDYETSGDITGDYRHSVSYGALGYFPNTSYRLADEDQRVLLASARETLDCYRRSGERLGARSRTPALEQAARVFVTLFEEGGVWGCVGQFRGGPTLADAIPALTVEALEDPRRCGSTPRGELKIQVHVMTPLKRIQDLGHVIAGETGAYLEFQGHRGLLLPEVATRWSWDRSAFLRALAVKAGVPDDALSDAEARVFVFRDQVFAEGTSDGTGARV